MKELKRSPKTSSHGRVRGGITQEIKGEGEKEWGTEKERKGTLRTHGSFQNLAPMTGTTYRGCPFATT